MNSKILIRYEPGGLIQERRNLKTGYEIWHVALNWQIGRVEAYYTGEGRAIKWRTLDHWLTDYKSGYASRDAAAQDLAANCPRTVALIAQRTARVLDKLGELPAEGGAATSKG